MSPAKAKKSGEYPGIPASQEKADPVYLDYNATAPVLPVVAEEMTAAWSRFSGNPSSPHSFGQEARAALESARFGLAEAIGFARHETFFTSGGTESNTQVFSSVAALPGPSHVITSPIEHPSVLRNCEWLEEQGVTVSYLPVDGQGRVQAEAVVELLRPETRLVSLMAANNETGVIQPVEELVRLVREHEWGQAPMIHSDAVQTFGRIPMPLKAWGVDVVTLAAHKIGGPKGIGLLALREGVSLAPHIRGGRQERNMRAGTESVPLALGFLAAVRGILPTLKASALRVAGMRDKLLRNLMQDESFFQNSRDAELLPNTLNGGFEGVPAQSLLVAMDLAGVAVSAGSACQSGSVEPSHVLTAMGLPRGRVESSLRISLGWGTEEDHIDRCSDIMLREVKRFRISKGS